MAASREFITSVDPEDIVDSVGNVKVTAEHFEQALEEVTPSVDEETKERYEEIERRFGKADAELDDEEKVSRTFQ
jgi:transitional endoplasmic reticulum ATPase